MYTEYDWDDVIIECESLCIDTCWPLTTTGRKDRVDISTSVVL